jgi:hypothetical protein
VSNFKLAIHKLLHWEYWPFDVVYIPVYFYWMYLAVKARAVFFGTAANPKIENGGFLMESKKLIYDALPKGTYPITLKFTPKDSIANILEQFKNVLLTYPIIAKPDIGMRGLATQKIESEVELINYVSKVNFDFLIQEYIDFPEEAGIFYVRMPGEVSGKITGIVRKEFVIVEGDGHSTLKELIESNPRFALQMKALEKEYVEHLNSVPAKNEKINLVPYGNHARGSKFTDVTAMVNENLTAVINNICTKVPEFFYGRMDIRFKSFEDLGQGKNFSIIELNGAGSDPTHIYDPKHSIFFAWKEIIRHLNILYKVSKANMKAGNKCLTFKEGIDMLKSNKQQVLKLQSFSSK